MKKVTLANKKYSKRHTAMPRKPVYYASILFTFLTIFGILLLIYFPHPSKAETYLSNKKDSCGLIGVSITGTPACNFYSKNTANGCVTPGNNPTSPGITNQTMTVTLTSLDGVNHQVAYSTSNNFCNSGYFSTNGQFCNCVDNEVNQNQTVSVPGGNGVNVTTTRSSPTGVACGSYQIDFTINSVDGNNNCTLGSGGAIVGAAINCETGTTCGSAPPPPPPPPSDCTTTPINCSACAAPANTCSTGNGTQTCTLSQPQTCNQVVVSRSCTLNNCINGNVCTNQACVPPTYTISGNIFKDVNKNGIIDTGESNYQNAFSIGISPNAGTITTNANGTYSITNLPAGTYSVSYLSLPNGFRMTSPLNGPPPSYTIIVGPGCKTNGALGASCQ